MPSGTPCARWDVGLWSRPWSRRTLAATTVLVVGGNGQLGAACCTALRTRGTDVRASVRDRARATDLEEAGVDLVELDLARHSQAAVERALADVEAIVLSANPVAPRAGDDVIEFPRALSAFVDEAAAHGVRRAVLPSIPMPSG